MRKDQIVLFKRPSMIVPEQWLSSIEGSLKDAMREYGGVLIKGLDSDRVDQTQKVAKIFSSEFLQQAFWSTPRTRIAENVFTSTEYRADSVIQNHSECSYFRNWPKFIVFHCSLPSKVGGETSVCSLAKASKAMGSHLHEVSNKEIRYIRTFHPGIDVPWQKAFGTDSPDSVLQQITNVGGTAQWLDGNRLQVWNEAQSVIEGFSGEPLWFNQAHIFHASSLGSKVRSAMVDLLGQQYLPRHAVFDDGSEIPDDFIENASRALTTNSELISWSKGDVLVIDNMRFAHGRMPFAGERKLFVTLLKSTSNHV